jgi:hypothetical protein
MEKSVSLQGSTGQRVEGKGFISCLCNLGCLLIINSLYHACICMSFTIFLSW